ncbi:hypothetical protein, partial [Pseudomonas aeruginosa]|uniref:hypothetical protein n=1 Tax=Pseudomonas aeruginosa TaxID=287 RepID=UPI0026746928
ILADMLLGDMVFFIVSLMTLSNTQAPPRFPTSIPTPLARPFAARLRTPTSAFRPYAATKRRQGFFRPANEHPST